MNMCEKKGCCRPAYHAPVKLPVHEYGGMGGEGPVIWWLCREHSIKLGKLIPRFLDGEV